MTNFKQSHKQKKNLLNIVKDHWFNACMYRTHVQYNKYRIQGT